MQHVSDQFQLFTPKQYVEYTVREPIGSPMYHDGMTRRQKADQAQFDFYQTTLTIMHNL